MTEITISTTKGTYTGSLDEVISWQCEYQGAMEEVEVCGLTVDVSHIEWGAGDEREAVLRAICDEIEGLPARTADHVADDGQDVGIVISVVDPRTGTVQVAWESGVRTSCDVLDLVVD